MANAAQRRKRRRQAAALQVAAREPAKVIDIGTGYQRRPKPLTDAPIWNFQTAWDVPTVRSALNSLEAGSFVQAAQLCDAMDMDDRIAGVLDTRVRALLGLEQEWGDPDDEAASEDETIAAFREAFPAIFPDPSLAELLRWGIRLNLGLGELVWFDKAGKYTPTPRLKVWHPQFVTFKWDTRSYWVTTQTNGNVEVTPGDGRWVLYTPHGEQRGWMHGLVRKLAIPFLIRQYAQRDSARYSEAYGLPVKQAIVPMDAKPDDKERFLRDLAQLAAESTVLTPQAEGTAGNPGSKFDFKMHELTGKGHEVFAAQLSRSSTDIAITILGQNLTTEAGTEGSHGAYAASKVHDRVRGDVLEFDAGGLAVCLREQGLRPYSVANHGGVEPPEFCWQTDPPEDQAAKTEAIDKLADAFVKFDQAQVPIDKRKLAESYGLPLVSPQEEARMKAEADAKVQADNAARIAAAAADAPKPPSDAPAPTAADPKLHLEPIEVRLGKIEADQALAQSVVKAATEISAAIKSKGPAQTSREVKFTRDPATGAVTGAKIEGE